MVAPAQSSAPLLERVSPGLLPELRKYLAIHRAEVEKMIRTGGPEAGLPASARYAKVFDGLLSSLFHAVQGALGREGTWRPVSLAAVGSYGRGALACGSDLDVRLLTERDPTAATHIAEALLYPLWDAGLAVGHQVVTPDDVVELARSDIPTATSLLDWRPLAGGDALGTRMLARVFEGLFGPSNIKAFLDALEERAARRSERYGGSVYLLEPDVKNGPGGIRDLDIAHWAARARWGVSELRGLIRMGVLVPREWQPIGDATDLFWRVRNLLHLYAGRRSDRLSFDRQEQLAIDLGYGPGGHAVEKFMSEYYRHARAITRAQEMILARAAPPPKRRPSEVRVEGGLKITNGALSITEPASLDSDPAIALRLYDEAVRRDLPVYPFARDALSRAASLPSFCERLRESEEAARLFVRLTTVAQRARFKSGSALQELHDVGLLVAMIPEFAPVVGRVHHDIYHVYTVDVHSVAAVDRLRALCRGDLAAEFPLASRLAAEISRPVVLYFACLLHDVGKDIGGKNHAERGFAMARNILTRLRASEADIAEARHLVLKHLRMYHVATRRDIDDPRTIAEFCADVHGREGLRELYLLTVADVSTTSPTALTSWKARMLDELYVASDAYLASGVVSDVRAGADALRAQVRAARGGDSAFLETFLSAMPERYLYANDAAQICRHAELAERAESLQASVEVLATEGPYALFGFVAGDRPGLLAKVTAALAASRLPVMSAQIHSYRDRSGRARALDLFWVRVGTEGLSAEQLVARVERDFNEILVDRVDARALVEGRRKAERSVERPTPAVATEINVDNRASAEQTVIEVTTRDRAGLLFTLADALQNAGLTIALAKINTEGSSVADVFYVTDYAGAKLTEPARIEALKAQLVAAIAGLGTEPGVPTTPGAATGERPVAEREHA